MAKKKEPNYYTAEGIKQWITACGFSNDIEAAASLGLPLRTFSRYKALGLPRSRPSAKLMAQIIVDKMNNVKRKKAPWRSSILS